MSKTHELYIAALDSIVYFYVLDQDEALEFFIMNSSDDPVEFKSDVLIRCIKDFSDGVMPIVAHRFDSEEERNLILDKLYKACISINPRINWAEWTEMIAGVNVSRSLERKEKKEVDLSEKITPSKHRKLKQFLLDGVVGQDEAVDSVVTTLKREYVGLSDDTRPLGVFLFAGSSGVGKTLLAKRLHEFISDGDYNMVRIDCGEYQHKHENQKLLGSPQGFVGYEDGGRLTEPLIKNPFTVVLIDEVEKAHVDILNTFLRVFDEGSLVDGQGNTVSFKKAIIIMTTNLGNDENVRASEQNLGFSNPNSYTSKLANRKAALKTTNDAIKKHFKPEILNRIDKVIVFNHLNAEDYVKIADLELQKLADKLAGKGYRFIWDESVANELAKATFTDKFGARETERFRRAFFEDKIADLLLERKRAKGTVFQAVHVDGEFNVVIQQRRRRKTKSSAQTSVEVN